MYSAPPGQRSCRRSADEPRWWRETERSRWRHFARSLDHDLDLVAWLERLARFETVDHEKTFQGPVGHRHMAGEAFGRVARGHADDLQPQRLGTGHLGEA